MIEGGDIAGGSLSQTKERCKAADTAGKGEGGARVDKRIPQKNAPKIGKGGEKGHKKCQRGRGRGVEGDTGEKCKENEGGGGEVGGWADSRGRMMGPQT